MIKKIRNILYVTDTLYETAIALFSAIIYLFMEKIGYSITDINLFISVFWIVSFVAEIPSGAFSDSFGRRNAAILSCIIRGIGLLAVFYSNGTITFLIISGILTAIGSALYSGSMSSWAIDEIQKIDPEYNFNILFSKEKIIATVVPMAAGYIGAQVIGVKNLGYPLVLSSIVLFITGIILIFCVKNDNPHVESIAKNKEFKIYKETIVSSIKFVKMNVTYLVSCCLFGCVAFLSTPAYNQWQLYFQNEDLGIISGYIHVLICIFGMIGAYLASKIKIKNKPIFFVFSNILIFSTLTASVFINDLYVSLIFFFLHVMILTTENVFQFTYLNELLNKETRNSLLSLYYTFDALINVLVITLSGMICQVTDLGISWVILGIVGLLLSIPLSVVLVKETFLEKV